jgi:predicted secreted protein
MSLLSALSNHCFTSNRRFTRALGAAALALTLGLASGCGASSVNASDLEEQVSSELENQVGQAPDSVDCPDDLDAEVGAEVRCTLNDGDQSYGVSVNVTEVDGTDVRFDIAVDDQPEG